jgi:23S rRNA (cytosine1962-C5)-methyltransferase
MLHATELGIEALGEHIAVECPTQFREWLESGSVKLGAIERLERALSVAASARFGIAREATAFRVADDAADDLPGVTIDRYGDFAVLSTTSEEALERRHEIAELVVGAGVRGVYEKHHPRADLRRLPAESVAPHEPLLGSAAPPDVIVREGALQLLVRLDEGLSTGLFCDQRDNRVRVQSLARGARFLNLFAYTCSFTASAVLGGAVESVSVDTSAKALDRGRRNLQLNGAAGPEHRLVRADAIEWLARARRRAQRFDLIVLDPPTFGTRGRRTFTVARDYEPLAADALSLLSPGGRLLAVTNHRKTQRSTLRRILHGAARKAGRRVAQMKDLPPPPDYPYWPGGDEPVKSVLVTVS